MLKEKGSGRALGLDPFFRDGLCFYYYCYYYYYYYYYYYRHYYYLLVFTCISF